jgi:hypothetical protein
MHPTTQLQLQLLHNPTLIRTQVLLTEAQAGGHTITEGKGMDARISKTLPGQREGGGGRGARREQRATVHIPQPLSDTFATGAGSHSSRRAGSCSLRGQYCHGPLILLVPVLVCQVCTDERHPAIVLVQLRPPPPRAHITTRPQQRRTNEEPQHARETTTVRWHARDNNTHRSGHRSKSGRHTNGKHRRRTVALMTSDAASVTDSWYARRAATRS